jgi:branched-chain amino acid transport system permease protein
VSSSGRVPRLLGRARRLTRNRDAIIYAILIAGVFIVPAIANFTQGTSSGVVLDQVANAGVFVLLAIGLNIVVGFAGLLDLGYAAFFAIGAYTYAMLGSGWLDVTAIHHAVHIPFWILLFVGMGLAAVFGLILGAPTLRLRGDYLAIVTLGFGEIVPRIFRIKIEWTGGINGITALDQPTLPVWLTGPWAGQDFALTRNQVFGLDPVPYYVLIVMLIAVSVVLATNLYRSRLGRAWMAIREDEVAAAAMGVNPVIIKLLAFSIGASFSGFAGVFFAAKLGGIDPTLFGFQNVSIVILVMVVLGGMGNISGVIVGAIGVYFLQNVIIPQLPIWTTGAASSIGLSFLNNPNGDWAGLGDEVQRLNFIIFGLILVGTMLFRPQGLFPSQLRQAELTKGTSDQSVFDASTS